MSNAAAQLKDGGRVVLGAGWGKHVPISFPRKRVRPSVPVQVDHGADRARGHQRREREVVLVHDPGIGVTVILIDEIVIVIVIVAVATDEAEEEVVEAAAAAGIGVTVIGADGSLVFFFFFLLAASF